MKHVLRSTTHTKHGNTICSALSQHQVIIHKYIIAYACFASHLLAFLCTVTNPLHLDIKTN